MMMMMVHLMHSQKVNGNGRGVKLPVTQGDFQSYIKPTEIVAANDDHGMPCWVL